MNSNLPRFKIISDYINRGVESLIKFTLTKKGIDQIKKYYANSGVIFSTGKSGYLLEDFGLIKKGSFNSKKLLAVNNKDRKIQLEDVF